MHRGRKRSQQREPETRENRTREEPPPVALPRRWALAALVLLAGPWVFAAMVALLLVRGEPTQPSSAAPRAQNAASKPQPAGPVARGEPGPWGRLERIPIIIAPPVEFIEELSERPELQQPSPWYFPGVTLQEFPELLKKMGFSEELTREMAARAKFDVGTEGQCITADQTLMDRMPSELRGNLCRYLMQHDVNVDQVNALRYPAADVGEWVGTNQFSSEIVDRLSRLVFRNGHFLLLFDRHMALNAVSSTEERARLLKALYRQPTFILRLLLDQTSDIEQIVDYWGSRGRAKDIRPLLESIASREEGGSIDVAHLLAPFARRRIFTYPGTQDGILTRPHDCHWTSLNFFNETPDDRWLNTAEVAAQIRNSYYQVFSDPHYGDLVVYLDANGDAFHSAIYIADGILFTKNGARPSRPWIFMDMAHMKDYYPRTGTIEVRYYRPKED